MTTSPAPVAPKSGGKSFISRELNGATFLTLEHIGHMALLVIVTALILSGVLAAMSMWFGTPGVATAMVGQSATLLGGAGTKAVESALSLGIVAALLVLVPALVILDRRTRAEWHKRPGFAGRLAYKVPVYATLAVLAAIEIAFLIQMLYVVLTSLALIGVQGAPIGSMYVNAFIPALIGYLLFGGVCWYVFSLAKGRDNGKMVSLALGALGAVAIVALFITATTVLHQGNDGFKKNNTTTPSPSTPRFPSGGSSDTYDEEYYRDLLDKYYQ